MEGMHLRMKKNHLAAAGLAAGLLAGGAAGLALGVPHLAGAQSTTSTTAPSSGASGSATTKDADRDSWIKDTLDGLVAKGTITQSQADEVLAALQAARPAKGPGGPGMGHGLHLGLEAAATALGMTEDALRTELRNGKTIADVAKEKNIELQKVIDAIVAAAKTELAQAVTDGKLTQAEADTRIANLQDEVTKMVNGQFMGRGPDGPRGRMRGGNPGSGTPPTTTPAPSTTAS